MRKIKVCLSIGYPKATHKSIMEVDDNATEEEIREEVFEWANNYIEIDWEEAGNEQ